MHDLNELFVQAQQAIADVQDLQSLEAIRVDYLGKKGHLTELLKGLNALPAQEKPQAGQRINALKTDIAAFLDEKKQALKEEAMRVKLAQESLDVTLPGREAHAGHLHPMTQIRQFIEQFFGQLGFDIVTGPEVETDFYNFEALNIPSHHPARAMHDTFYFGDGRLLRTHTSSVQIRTLEKRSVPIKLIAPGRVYRYESDMTHTPMFHQVEGLAIDKDITMTHLRGILNDFFKRLFGVQVQTRFRSSYFPFTEPSAEVDISCTQCQGSGCRSCKFTGWLEVLGCGMVHPHVLRAVNISDEIYQGWAFGMGIDRLTMLYFGIDDLRLMFENDLTFLKQF